MKKRWSTEEEVENEEQSRAIPAEAFNFNFDYSLLPSIEEITAWNKENLIQVNPPVPTGYAMDSDTYQPMKVGFGFVNPYIINHFITGSSFVGYNTLALASQHWLIQKGCFQKARDAMKGSYELSFNSNAIETEELESIETLDKQIGIANHSVNAVGFNNVFGIRHILFVHKDENFDYEKPFNPDAFNDGKYAGIAQVDPYWIMPVIESDDLINPASISFYEPEFWLVKGRKYHKSHFVILRGEPVPDMLKPTYRYGGISLAQRVLERVYYAEKTLNEVPQLVMTKRLNTRQIDMTKVMANKAKAFEYLEHVNQYKDNHGTLLYDKSESLGQIDTHLSGLDEAITTQFVIVCGVLDYPISKLLGNGHSGFSTGETDENYYIASCQTVQENYLTPVLEAHYLRVSHALFNEDKKINIVWNPMKVESSKEKAETNFIKSQTANNYYNIGAVDNYEVREYLISEKESGFNNLEMPPDFEERMSDPGDSVSES